MSGRELPTSWKWTMLGDVLSGIEAGASFKCEERPPEEHETGVVKVSAVTWGTYNEHESKTVRSADRINERLLIRPGDFLFSRANTINLVGTCVIAGTTRHRVMLSDKILRFEFVEVLPEWVLHYLRSWWGRSEIERLATGNQESMRNIGQERIRAIRLPVAPVAEQRRIIAALEEHLSDLDAAVSGLERARVNVERYREAVRDAAVTGSPCPHDSGSASPTGEDHLPGGWSWLSVGECASAEPNAITDGPFGSKLKTAHYVDSGPRVIRLQNIGRGQFVDALAHISPDHFATLAKHRVFAGDVVIAALGEALPRACIVPEHVGPAIVKADCIRFRPDESKLLPAYANIALNAESTRKRVTSMVHGVGRPRLNLSEIRAVQIPVPPLTEQAAIVAEVERRLAVADRTAVEISVQLARAKRLRQSILKRAFEGKLVPQDPSDEPASVLLERISVGRAASPAASRGSRRATALRT